MTKWLARWGAIPAAPMSILRNATPPLLVMGAVACEPPAVADDGSATARGVVVDSAGVDVVTFDFAGLEAGTIELGRHEWVVGWSTSGVLFESIAAASTRPDGSFLVADEGSRRIYHFSPRGEPVDSLGGTGEGPGEFSDLSSFAALENGGVAVLDGLAQRLTLFDSQGNVDLATSVERLPVVRLDLSASLGPDRLLWIPSAYAPAGLTEPGAVDAPIISTALDGSDPDTLVVIPLHSVVRADGRLNPVLLAPWARAQGTGRGVAVVNTARPEVTWYAEDGRVSRIARWTDEQVAVDDETWAEYLDGVVAAARETPSSFSLPDAELRELRDAERSYSPDHFPLYAAVGVGADGSVWLQRWTPGWSGDPTYLVVSAQTDCIMHVRGPASFRFLAASEELVLGRLEDEYGADAIAAFRRPHCGTV